MSSVGTALVPRRQVRGVVTLVVVVDAEEGVEDPVPPVTGPLPVGNEVTGIVLPLILKVVQVRGPLIFHRTLGEGSKTRTSSGLFPCGPSLPNLSLRPILGVRRRTQ